MQEASTPWTEFAFLQTLSRLFQFAENVKRRRIFQEFISWGPHSSLGRQRKIRHRLFTSSIKRAIRHFHVLVVQWRQRNVQKSVMHVQSCCFLNKPIAFLTFSLASPSSLLKLPIKIFNNDREDILCASGLLRSGYFHDVNFWFCS